MAVYKNDYSKNEDFALWNLHEIRNKMARRKLNSNAINKAARELIRKYHLSKIKLQTTV